jgi:hypothetical protein
MPDGLPAVGRASSAGNRDRMRYSGYADPSSNTASYDPIWTNGPDSVSALGDSACGTCSRTGSASRTLNWTELHPRVRLSVESNDGRLVVSESEVDLLHGVVKHGTLVAATRALRIPYRTARSRLQVLEGSLGVRLFETASAAPVADGVV